MAARYLTTALAGETQRNAAELAPLWFSDSLALAFQLSFTE